MSQQRDLAVRVAKGEALASVLAADPGVEAALIKELPDFTGLGDDREADLWAFDRSERQSFDELLSLVQSYLEQPDPQRPLCIAVFGAPGSGKSRSVKQIRKQLRKSKAELNRDFPLFELNLTQLQDTAELSSRMRDAHQASRKAVAPFVFFDEFDAPQGGTPWGWLSWFLAPMQDAAFEHGGERHTLKKAIYFFAGGTAECAAEFGGSKPKAFAAAKGPDFASRLRATLDVRGPNDVVGRDLRRALTVRFELGQARKVTEKPGLTLSKNVVRKLLDAGRYLHGARSLAAVVEIACARAVAEAEPNAEQIKVHSGHLPGPELSALHVDRGFLDPGTIGGLVGMSGGGGRVTKGDLSKDVWESVAKGLMGDGACIAYGGDWRDNGLTYRLLSTAKHLPRRLGAPDREPPFVEVFANQDPKVELEGAQITYFGLATELAASEPLNSAVQLTHMRRVMTARCVARILMLGREEGYGGRLPGIVEEAMWSLAQGQPVYLVGGLGGAAAALGPLLGLASHPAGPSLGPGRHPFCRAELLPAKEVFAPASMGEMPLTLEESQAWLMSYAIGGDHWPDNGLSVAENQDLFAETDADRIWGLIQRGLSRVFRS